MIPTLGELFSLLLCPSNGIVNGCLDALDDPFDRLCNLFDSFGSGLCTICALAEMCVGSVQGWSNGLGFW